MEKKSCILLLLLALLVGSVPLAAQNDDTQKNPREVADAIIKEAGKHLGKPYLYGGNGPQSFDCTGFTCFVFNKFGYKLSRTSADQAKDGREVKGGIEHYAPPRRRPDTWVSSLPRTR